MLDPVVRGSIPPPDFFSLPGIEQARAFVRGEVPGTPLSRLVGYRPTQMSSGSVAFVMPISPWVQYANGEADVLVLLEEAMASAALTGVAPATRVDTTVLSVSHLRPVRAESGRILVRARVVSSGATSTTVEGHAEDGLGRLVATASGSFLLRPVVPPPPPHAGFPPVDEPTYRTPDPHLRPLPPGAVPQDELPGLDGMRRMIGEESALPPVMRLLGMRPTAIEEDGSGTMCLTASPWLCSRSAHIQPGPLCVLMNVALGSAALAAIPPGHVGGVLGQSFTFLRGAAADERELLAQFHLVHRDEDLLVAEVEVTDADGHRVALGTQSSVIREQRRGRPGHLRPRERVLATIMFTDIVGSTRRAQELGDERWRELLAEHDAVVRQQLRTFDGREIKSTGDGFLATFDQPARAVRCARAIRDGLRRHDIEIRTGVHTGECEQVGNDVAGIAVHAASRIGAAAAAGEVLVSSTVHDLVAGSGIEFVDRGVHVLKDLDGKRQLFAVAG